MSKEQENIEFNPDHALPENTGELAEQVAEPEAPAQTVPEALQSIEKRDTLDVYGRRIRGTSALGTWSTLGVAAPFTLPAVAQPGAIVITSSVAAGTAITFGTVYAVQRLTEGRRAQKAENSQQVIRDALEEPVDIIKYRKAEDADKLAIRWYGADEQYGGDVDSGIAGRFEKVIDFAETNGIKKIIASANIAALDGEVADDIDVTTTQEIFKKAKGDSIKDTQSDEHLAEFTPDQARKLLEQLKSVTTATKMETIADWLVDLNPSHPARKILEEWKDLDNPKELLPTISMAMRHSLERHFGNNRLAEPIRQGSDSFKTESVVRVDPNGVHYTDMARRQLADGSRPTAMSSKTFSNIVGGNISQFIDELLERQNAKIAPGEQWKLELALYHLLTTDNISETVSKRRFTGDTNYETKTVFQRMLEQPPKARDVSPNLPSRKVAIKKDETIKYKRDNYLKYTLKKFGAATVAIVAGGLVGIAWAAGAEKGRDQQDICEPETTASLVKPTEEELEVCDTFEYKLGQIPANAADIAIETIGDWQADMWDKALEWGFIDPEQPQEVPLTGQSNASGIGDVELDSNPVIWTLSPGEDASTTGYWYTNIQSRIDLDTGIDSDVLPPYSGLAMSLQNPAYRHDGDVFTTDPSPEPTPGRNTQIVRELDIPMTPESNNEVLVDSRLINVTGQLPTSAAKTLDFSNTNGTLVPWQSFDLPVIEGGDIVAVSGSIYDSDTDTSHSVDLRVIQKDNGTFNLLFPGGQPNGILQIDYWVDPQAETELPLQATEPMTAQQPGDSEQELSDLLSPGEVAGILESLGLPPTASASEVAEAIRNSDTYSFTPYKDSGLAGETPLDTQTVPTDEILVNVAAAAESMDSSNCNVAAMIGLIASRGQEDLGFVNGANGFYEDGDGVLSQAESHQWIISSFGETIDGTPFGFAESPQVEDADSGAKGPEILSLTTKLAGGLLVLLVGAGAARHYGPRVKHQIQKHQIESAKKWLDDDNRAAELNKDAAMLRQLVFARPGTPLQAGSQPLITQPVTEQLQSLPAFTRKELNAKFRKQQSSGQSVPIDTRRRLHALTAKNRTIRRTTNKPTKRG